MKKLICFISTFLLIILMACPVMAKNYEYFLDGPDMIVGLSDDYIAIWRGMDEDSPVFEYLDTTYEDAMDMLDEQDLALYAFSEYVDLYLSFDDNGDSDEWNSLSDADLEDLAAAVADQYSSDDGIDSVEYGVYKTKEAKYIMNHIATSDRHLVLYSTDYEEWVVHVEYVLYDSDFKASHMSEAESVIDSFKFGCSSSDVKGSEPVIDESDSSEKSPKRDYSDKGDGDYEDGGGLERGNSGSDGVLSIPSDSPITGILIIVLICIVPSLIYRYVIKEEPVSNKKGIIFSVIFFVISIIGAFFLDGWIPFVVAAVFIPINFVILTKGRTDEAKAAPAVQVQYNQPVQPQPIQPQPVQMQYNQQAVQPQGIMNETVILNQAAPVQPVTPVQPVAPAAPVQPVTPVQPAQPAAPVQSAAPAAPAKQTAGSIDDFDIWTAANAGMDDLDEFADVTPNLGAINLKKICPVCRTENIDSAKFCSSCGRAL